MLRHLLVAAALSTIPAFAQSQALQCEAEPHGNRNKITCFDAAGNVVRADNKQKKHLFLQLGLRQLGCDIPVLDGVTEPSQAAIDCFHQQYGKPGPLTRQERGALEAAGSYFDEATIAKTFSARRIKPASETSKGLAFAKTIDHPDAAIFVHPASRDTWMGGEIDLLDWVSRRSGAGAIRLRWADPQAFAGRIFTAWDGDIPLFLVEFGQNGALVHTPETTATNPVSYETRAGFTCIPNPGGFAGECLGITLQQPRRDGPWRVRPALHIMDRGATRPLAFGAFVEGRTQWDQALATRRAAQIATQTALEQGEMLDSLPLDGIEASMAALIARTYAAPAAFNDTLFTLQRMPFIAYHRTYAVSCADHFDGPATSYKVVAYGLADYSYVPFQKYEVWESYVADAFDVQSAYYAAFATGLAEFPTASFQDWTAPQGGPDISSLTA